MQSMFMNAQVTATNRADPAANSTIWANLTLTEY